MKALPPRLERDDSEKPIKFLWTSIKYLSFEKSEEDEDGPFFLQTFKVLFFLSFSKAILCIVN